jgi:hypothetical protein
MKKFRTDKELKKNGVIIKIINLTLFLYNNFCLLSKHFSLYTQLIKLFIIKKSNILCLYKNMINKIVNSKI